MFNPFAEAIADSLDTDLVEQAKFGDRAALEKLILRHQAWIYNIAIRMVFHPQDAEEVTQEVLTKVFTKLNDLPDPKSVPVELPVLVEEAKNGCTMGMLLCLDRKQRLIFTLGAILGASDAVGAEVLEMTADNFRQSLARTRRDLHSFMNNQCGLVNTRNPCRCPKKTRGFIEAGHVDPYHLLFVPEHVERVWDVAGETVREIDDIVERQHAAIYRDHPFLQPSDQVHWFRRIIESDDVRTALHLN